MITDEFRAYLLEQLSRITPVTGRRMFGGLGIYADGFFFALADDDALYFKVDDSNRGDFERIGSGPFMPFGEGGHVMQYYLLPGDILEDAGALRPWVEGAIAVARSARSRKQPRRA
jgi:DNA transformation protein and related proteins